MAAHRLIWSDDEPGTQHVPAEDVRPGDAFEPWLGRVLSIEPYDGPLADIIFAHAECDTGRGIALGRGTFVQVRRAA